MKFSLTIAFLLSTFTVAQVKRSSNLALGKPTKQLGISSYMLDGFSKTGESENPVDGNPQTDSENITCSDSSPAYVTWWFVDLLDVYIIDEIGIFVRKSGTMLNDFVVEVSRVWDDTIDEMVDPVLCYQQSSNYPRDSLVFQKCIKNVTGRYVRVTKTKPLPKSLSLCTFEVYGYYDEKPKCSSVNKSASGEPNAFQGNQRTFLVDYFPERRSPTEVLESLQTSNYLVCFARCLEVTNCTSINIEITNDSCDMLSDRNEGQSATGWKNYRIREPSC